MTKQKYLLGRYKEQTEPWPQYSVMAPFINRAKEIIVPNGGTKNWDFQPSGMGRTGISKLLKAGSDPLEFYNGGMSTSNQALKRELLIREFWAQSKTEWEPRRPDKSWLDSGSKSDALFQRWKNGETGYLLVDAGMRQLSEEGFMPNRVRMICASFLTKNYRVYWKKGENYFASKLIDYNPTSNLGNWQWISGAGFNSRLTDVLSPDIQLKKFDPTLSYCWSILGKDVQSTSASKHIQDRVLPFITYEDSKAAYLKLI